MIEGGHALNALPQHVQANVNCRMFPGHTPEETKAVTGQAIGGVTVFGLPDSIPLYVDSRIMALDWVIVGGGNRSTKIKMPPGELRKIPHATVADIAIERGGPT